jgi:ribonuclease J
VLHLVHPEGRRGIPSPFEAQDIVIYWPDSFERTAAWKKIRKNHGKMRQKRISIDALVGEPGKYVMVFRPSMWGKWFDGRQLGATTCIYSYWEGYLKKQDWVDLKARVEEGGGRFVQHHTSGHIYAPDLVDLVKEIGPDVVVPIHTQKPDALRSLFGNAVNLEDGEWWQVEAGDDDCRKDSSIKV